MTTRLTVADLEPADRAEVHAEQRWLRELARRIMALVIFAGLAGAMFLAGWWLAIAVGMVAE